MHHSYVPGMSERCTTLRTGASIRAIHGCYPFATRSLLSFMRGERSNSAQTSYKPRHIYHPEVQECLPPRPFSLLEPHGPAHSPVPHCRHA